MPKSKNRKNHKQKVEQRNQRIRAAHNKIKREFQEKLQAEIKKDEQESFGIPSEPEVVDEGNIRAATVEEIQSN